MELARWDIFRPSQKKLEKPADIAVKIVNSIKQYIFNPAVDLITLLSRTDIDNKIVEIVRQYLPTVLSTMLKAENIISDIAKGDLTSLLRIFADYIKGISAEARGKWWAELAALLLPLIAGQPVAKPVAMSLTQGVYLKAA